MADFLAGGPTPTTLQQNGSGSSSHSRQSSMSSERSSQGANNKENNRNNNGVLPISRRDSDDTGSDLSGGQLILRDGGRLGEESGTENAGFSPAFRGVTKGGEGMQGGREGGNPLEIPPRQPSGSGIGTARHKVSKSGNMASSIPEVEINIPNDGCLASFSADAMATFFRHMRLEDRLVNHLHRNGLDGRKFGRLKDTDLDNLRLNNPVIVYFRDRTAPVVNKKNKQRLPFVL